MSYKAWEDIKAFINADIKEASRRHQGDARTFGSTYSAKAASQARKKRAASCNYGTHKNRASGSHNSALRLVADESASRKPKPRTRNRKELNGRTKDGE
jgi:hypothetical protein